MTLHEIIATAFSELAKHDPVKAQALLDMLIEAQEKEVQEAKQRLNAVYS